MAGIIFWHKSVKYNPGYVNDKFISLEYNKGRHFKQGDWNIIVFPKKNYNIKNWDEFPDGIICATGTFSYKESFYEHSLPLIYNDIRDNCLQTDEFRGTFLIVILQGNDFFLIWDGAGLVPLYNFEKYRVYSTSFAGLIECSDCTLTFDPDAATELLTTGVLTGDQSLLKEIKRNIGEPVEGIKTYKSATENYTEPGSRKEALEQQMKIAGEYFERIISEWLNYIPEGIVDVGITGGMDSRLAAALALNKTQKVIFHTHWRREGIKNDDFRYAHIFAQTTGHAINTREVLTPFEMNNAQLVENFERAYCLSDGIIRPGCYWDEEYSTASYRSGVTNTPFLRLLGFGGEQYRNGERLPLKSVRTLESWIKWEMMYQFAGRYFSSVNAEKRIISRIENNLKKHLNNNNLNLNLFNYKKYIRLIQSPSYRSLQANMENRLGFCLNPFMDICLSVPSGMAIPFLGRSLSFQLDMLKRIAPEIASVPNGYGFNFFKGEPVHLKTAAVIWQNLPPWFKYPLYAGINNFFRTDYLDKLAEKHSSIRELDSIIAQIGLPVNIKKHRMVRSRARLMLNLGYFLKRNQQKIRFQ